MQTRVTISILTYNRSHILKDLLSTLIKITYSPIEIIVVDNHSTDETSEIVKKEFPTVHYFRTQSNIGVAARNIGLSNATGDVVITLDDDIFGITDYEITALVTLFTKYQDIGAICFKVLDYFSGETCNWCHPYKVEEFSDKQFLTNEISEGAVAFRRSVLSGSGLYPADFFISYEGADLMCRMLNNGYKTIYSPEIVVRHRHASEGRPSWRRYYYDTRNQIWFVARNYPLSWGIRYLFMGLSAMLVYSIRDGYLRYWIKGVRDGIINLPKVIKQRKCLSKETLDIINEIISNKPNFFYMIKKRLFQKNVKI